MPTVDRVITRAWRILPGPVRTYEPFTNADTGAPTSTAQRTILIRLLTDTAEGYRFTRTHWLSKREVSDAVAAAIAERIASAAPRLVAAAQWHAILRSEYVPWNRKRTSPATDSPTEWVMVPSLELADRHGSPGSGAADRARSALDDKAGRPDLPTGPAVQRHIRAHAGDLEAALGRAWSRGFPVEHPSSEWDALLDAYQYAAFAAQHDAWAPDSVARADAIARWTDIVASAAQHPPTVVPDLSATDPPSRPALRGTAALDTPALDRSIADRMTRVFRRHDEVVVQPLSDDGPTDRPSFAGFAPAGMVEYAIASSSAPLGLAEPSARAVLLAVHRITRNVSWQPDELSRRIQLEQFSQWSDQYFIRAWNRVGFQYASLAQPGTTLGRLLESPRALFLARAWIRAARTQFQEPQWRPDARMTWEHATGVFRSVQENAPQIYHYAQQVDRAGLPLAGGDRLDDETEHDAPGKRAEPPDDAFDSPSDVVVDRVLAVGVDVDGADADTDFWFGSIDGDPSARRAWDRWVAECARRDGRDVAEYPSHDMVLQRRIAHDNGRGTGAAPATMDDVTAITEFLFGRRTPSRDTVAALLRRSLDPAGPPDDGTDTATWTSWCREYVTSRRDQGEDPGRIPTHAQMVALLRKAAGL